LVICRIHLAGEQLLQKRFAPGSLDWRHVLSNVYGFSVYTERGFGCQNDGPVPEGADSAETGESRIATHATNYSPRRKPARRSWRSSALRQSGS